MTYHSDTELEAGTNEHTPMLRRRERNAIDKKQMSKRKFYRFLEFFAGGIYATDASTYDPIEIMLNTEDEDERNRLTEIWRDNRLKELSFVGVVVSAYLFCIPRVLHFWSGVWHVMIHSLGVGGSLKFPVDIGTPIYFYAPRFLLYLGRTTRRCPHLHRLLARYPPPGRGEALVCPHGLVLRHYSFSLQYSCSSRPDRPPAQALVARRCTEKNPKIAGQTRPQGKAFKARKTAEAEHTADLCMATAGYLLDCSYHSDDCGHVSACLGGDEIPGPESLVGPKFKSKSTSRT